MRALKAWLKLREINPDSVCRINNGAILFWDSKMSLLSHSDIDSIADFVGDKMLKCLTREYLLKEGK